MRFRLGQADQAVRRAEVDRSPGAAALGPTAPGEAQGAGMPGPAPAGLPGPEGYPRTVHKTREGLLNRGTWASSIVEFADGGAERTVYWAPEERPARKGRRVKRERPDANRRAARKVRVLMRQQGFRVMWTFTWPAPGEYCRESAFKQVAGWLKDYGQQVTRGRGYITVPELHPDGHGWHIHLFTGGGRYPVEVLDSVRESWTAYLGRKGWKPSGGATSIRVNVKLWPGCRKAAWYAAKYAGKAFGEGDRSAGARRYTLSLGLSILVIRKTGSLAEMLATMPGRSCTRAWSSTEDAAWQGYPTVWQAWEVGEG